jgi:cyclase
MHLTPQKKGAELMLAKRIVPCLDVDMGRVVKGINFMDIKDVGDPVECASLYDRQGADEIVFLDITATSDGRATMANVVRRTAKKVFVPLTVGGGIRTIDDFTNILRAGADKVSVNSAAVRDRELISRAADRFGSQCVVVAIDARRRPGGGFSVVINGGRIDTGLDAVEWAKEVERLGCGEILLTSMDTDGTKNGFDIELTDTICRTVNIPVIASGGCGSLEHFAQVFEKTGADAALAASLFHYHELEIKQVKNFLRGRNIPVRI